MTLLIIAASVLGAAVITLGILLAVTATRLGAARQRVADIERGLVEVEPAAGSPGWPGRQPAPSGW